MNPETGYYSLIQYCPDPSRLEAANVGVLLFSPKHCFLKALTARTNSRIRRFFGDKGFDSVRLNSFKKGLEERVEAENANINTLDDLKRFVDSRAGQLQLTPPRYMRVTDPDRDLRQLFDQLVGGKPRSEPQQSLRTYLGERFTHAGLLRKIRTDLHVHVPAFNRSIDIPFAYKNGRFNLIQPARFQTADAVRVIPAACRYAVEGRSLFQHQDATLGDMELIVLGQFPASADAARRVVSNILSENHVRLYTTTELDGLLEHIRQTGKDLDSEAETFSALERLNQE